MSASADIGPSSGIPREQPHTARPGGPAQSDCHGAWPDWRNHWGTAAYVKLVGRLADVARALCRATGWGCPAARVYRALAHFCRMVGDEPCPNQTCQWQVLRSIDPWCCAAWSAGHL